MVEMDLWDIAYSWWSAPSMREQWEYFKVAFFHSPQSKGCLQWGFAHSPAGGEVPPNPSDGGF